MAQSSSASSQDNLGQVFFEAFQLYTSGIINNLPSNNAEAAKATAVEIIVPQLNSDYNRLIYIVDTIQARVKRDVVWIDSAISIYDGIASSIDPFFSAPGLPADRRGCALVQHYLMTSVYADFTKTMTERFWNVGLIHFLGRLGASRESIGALTTNIARYIMGRMMLSERLFDGQNLGLCLDYIVHVGPFLDSEAAGAVNEFGGMLLQLRERVKMGGTVGNMAVCWLFKMRGDGWRAQLVE
ncbi:hypothetical protein G6514_001410 [Epicoccum nigrum]|nr:hypothetical protein G6514_001410 [Epicoccum nigrum]